MKNSCIDRLENCLLKGEYEKVLNEIEKIDLSKYSEEEQSIISEIKEKAKIGNAFKKIESFIYEEKDADAKQALSDVKILVESYQGSDKNHFTEQVMKAEKKLVELGFKKEFDSIKKLVDNEKWEQALSRYEQLKGECDEQSLGNLREFLHNNVREKAKKLYSLNNLSEFLGFISIISKSESFTALADDIKNKESGTLESQIKEFVNDKDYEKANSLLLAKGAVFDKEKKEVLQKHIEESKEATLQQAWSDLLGDIEKALEAYDVKKASELKTQADNNPKANLETLKRIEEEIGRVETALADEKQFQVSQPLYSIGKFNIPKPNTEGEDAEPYIYVDPNRNWGVIGVFDGMGGAGARKYTDSMQETEISDETDEESAKHTSAYWGSLFVRQAVEEMINGRHLGEEPIMYIEKYLYQTIKSKLDKEIERFPEAKIKSPSKMVKKLPTTMALCAYFIKDGAVSINCYWAGDSRVYLFSGDRTYFLTRDDANAPDNDPFSPANMDLAMNNAIWQDQPFIINKYTKEFEFDKSKPFVLMAATDGCFGYFKNPIEFEYKIRETLSEASEWGEWKEKVVKAIKDNGQQDDYSMALVAIGSEEKDFNAFQDTITSVLEKKIFSEFQTWEKDAEKVRKELEDEIATLNNKIEKSGENKKTFIRKQEKLKKILDDINKDIDLSSDLTPTPVISILNTKIEEHKSSEKEEDGKSEKINSEHTTKKAKLEELLLEIERKNNLWYQTYKDECVEIVDSNQISHLN